LKADKPFWHGPDKDERRRVDYDEKLEILDRDIRVLARSVVTIQSLVVELMGRVDTLERR
jgi:hypothetical protein